MDYQKIKQETDEKFSLKNFEPGDIFSEMLSYFEIIVRRERDNLLVIQRKANKFELKKFTVEEYVKHCQYSSGYFGYWIDFMKNDTDMIATYIEALIEQEGMTLDIVRELKLDLIL